MKILKLRTRMGGNRDWYNLYRCDCGKRFEAMGYKVRQGRVKSCGCLASRTTAARNYKHGMTRSPAWRSWNAMIRRCKYPSMRGWEHYGGRGITVCSQWSEFAQFFADMGERPDGMQLGRLDNDGNYEPGNCAWQTASENQGEKNRRVKPWEFTIHGISKRKREHHVG
jgi:hypothetical protein